MPLLGPVTMIPLGVSRDLRDTTYTLLCLTSYENIITHPERQGRIAKKQENVS